MKRDPASFLWDVQQACAAIPSFVEGVAPERYAADLLLRSAVERQLQNIGEAVSQLSKLYSVQDNEAVTELLAEVGPRTTS